ncbi:hypothetical protein D9758_002975 [Tetrapyrgos nigripes]|uniref:DUF6535 domain-containing protein n=1 Tax=Tetrapyrgos nigripes TaxID=182062 RepID=A0A8H5LTT3_9AGAR|nr:hypothetical protein D9758_002975 [Tetrapyrgos nigripes]
MALHGGAADPEKNDLPFSNGRFKPTSDDDACFKLWNMYISQAQEYDKALIESWKSDMDGMLLFSALYSAVLAAFIIESYKNLQDDPASTTSDLLVQMSRQLALLSNGTVFTFEEPTSFHPTATSLVCNLLWFLALALALTCSLLAAFVQQWTRDFLHKTTMRPSPVVQARVLAFSYFGLRRFGMHTFVDTIPILLHISLFFFFAGLVAFLLPVSFPLMCLMAGVLAGFMLIYCGLSYIPLVFLDAPYRTPLSDFLWRSGNRLHGYIIRLHGLHGDLSLTEAMIEKSLQESSDRDSQCMEYTMKQLNFDTELVPMFEAIPEAVLSPRGGVRLENFKLVASLIQSSEPENSIVSRISHFISISGTSSDPANQVRDMTYCLKALRSLALLVIQKPTQNDVDDTLMFWFDRSLLQVLAVSDTTLRDHITPAIALVRASRLQSLKRCIDMVAQFLSFPSTPAYEKLQLADNAFHCMSSDDIDWTSKMFLEHFTDLRNVLMKRISDDWQDHLDELVKEAQTIVSQLQSPGRWKAALISILGEFLSRAITHAVTPIEMDVTWKTILASMPLSFFDQTLEVEEDEAAASFVLNTERILPSIVQPEMFILVLRLFFSTNRGFSFHGSAKCRSIVQSYLFNCQEYQRNYIVIQDTECHLEQCILRDLRTDETSDPGWCVAAIEALYFGLDHRARNISPRLYVFAKQMFDLIPNVSAKFNRERWWPYTEALTEWILCVDMYNKLYLSETSLVDTSPLDDIRALGGRLMPDIPIPEPPSNPESTQLNKQWAEDIRKYVVSMVVSIISKFIIASLEDPGGDLLGDWSGMLGKLYQYEGRIYDSIQLRFAESIMTLVSGVPWDQPKESAASQVFCDWVWRLHQADWVWITDLKSARILTDAIRRHKNHVNFKGMFWYEQAALDRCLRIIRDAEPEEEENGEEPEEREEGEEEKEFRMEKTKEDAEDR